MRSSESRDMRKISNNLEYITDLFSSVHEKHSIEITEENIVAFKGDLAISIFRAGSELIIAYDDYIDEYEIYHRNKANNFSGKCRQHKHYSNTLLSNVVMHCITLHYDYSQAISKSKKKKSAYDKLEEERQRKLEEKRQFRKLKPWKNKA